MPQPAAASVSRLPRPRESQDWGMALLMSPWLWTVVLTVAVHQLPALIPATQPFFKRYLLAHWILQLETACACLGLALLLSRLPDLFAGHRALAAFPLTQFQFGPQTAAADRALAITRSLTAAPMALHQTQWFDRLGHACEQILSRRAATGLLDHLKYRAELAAEALATRHEFPRTLVWGLPILGALGTVIRLSSALAGLQVNADQWGTTLELGLQALGVAFDSTALGLGLAVGLLFVSQLVLRAENDLLRRIEDLAVSRLVPLFPEGQPLASPVVEAESQAAGHLLERTQSLVNWQTELWQAALEDLRTRWVESAQMQQNDFSAALRQGMISTLEDHSTQLSGVRGELLDSFRAVAREMSGVVQTLQQTSETAQNRFEVQVQATWSRLAGQFEAAQTQQRQLLVDSAQVMGDSLTRWHADLERSTQMLQAQLAELRGQSQTLLSISERTGELQQLQATLTHNLQNVRALEAFEETIHSLNAAIHLLSSRSRSFPAAA